MYKVEISHSRVVTKLIKQEWRVVDQKLLKDDTLKDVYGHTPQIESQVQQEYTIYSQQINDEEFDLKRVIAAINGLVSYTNVSDSNLRKELQSLEQTLEAMAISKELDPELPESKGVKG